MLELVMSKKKNQEMQEIDKVQKIEIEQLLKQCIQHENLHSQQSGHILELEGRINDLLSTIQVSSTCQFFITMTCIVIPYLFHCEILYTSSEILP